MASSRTPGIIGQMDKDTGGWPYQLGIAYPTGFIEPPKEKRRKKRAGTRELTVVGDFPAPWKNEQAEIDALGSKTWFPATRDFIAVVSNSTKRTRQGSIPIVSSSEALIHHILDQPLGSIDRLNILTHGNEDSIALSGEITEDGAVFFTDELDFGTLSGLLRNGILYKNKRVAWKEVERRFGDGAEIYVFACKAGISEKLLKNMANFFNVTVKAFDNKLDYYVTFENGRVERRRIKVAKHGTIGNAAKANGQLDFHRLTPNMTKKPELKDPFR